MENNWNQIMRNNNFQSIVYHIKSNFPKFRFLESFLPLSPLPSLTPRVLSQAWEALNLCLPYCWNQRNDNIWPTIAYLSSNSLNHQKKNRQWWRKVFGKSPQLPGAYQKGFHGASRQPYSDGISTATSGQTPLSLYLDFSVMFVCRVFFL